MTDSEWSLVEHFLGTPLPDRDWSQAAFWEQTFANDHGLRRTFKEPAWLGDRVLNLALADQLEGDGSTSTWTLSRAQSNVTHAAVAAQWPAEIRALLRFGATWARREPSESLWATYAEALVALVFRAAGYPPAKAFVDTWWSRERLDAARRACALAEFRASASRCVRCHEDGLLHGHPDGRRARPLLHEEGTGHRRVLMVFEAPNHSDTYDPDKGRMTCDPDTDETGRFIHELLAHVDLAPTDVMMTNAVLCLPAERGGKYAPRAAQIDACSMWLRQLIDAVDPRVVVACGAKALEALGRLRPHGLVLARDVAQPVTWGERHLLALYHPSGLGRVSRPRAAQLQDFEALRAFTD